MSFTGRSIFRGFKRGMNWGTGGVVPTIWEEYLVDEDGVYVVDEFEDEIMVVLMRYL
uniref:Uncharacterized protein n=1 Tax=viral metagenome TaxID=1070528 RepID=A0A6M3JFC8_9ZZZZ